MFKLNDLKKSDKFTLIDELARRRGFFWQSYKIYGGVSGFITYGFLGTKLKQKIENKIRQIFHGKNICVKFSKSDETDDADHEKYTAGYPIHGKKKMPDLKHCKQTCQAHPKGHE